MLAPAFIIVCVALIAIADNLSPEQGALVLASMVIFTIVTCLIRYGVVALLQISIAAAVMCAAIYWQWPGSGYSHVFVGILLAWLVTCFPFVLADMGRQLYWWLQRWQWDWKNHPAGPDPSPAPACVNGAPTIELNGTDVYIVSNASRRCGPDDAHGGWLQTVC